MEYPNVKNAHIVPRTYLANFASDGKIGVHLGKERRSRVLPIENVGTRRRFYRRKRPDGTEIDDIEWSLGQGEAVATPVLRSFDENWPLSLDDKLKLAELFAYQLLRGPRWKEEYEEQTRRFIDGYRHKGKLAIGESEEAFTHKELEDTERIFLEDSYRLIRMLMMAPTLTSILGSMHWTLVEFGSPVIATSDHPVVLWSGENARIPQPAPLDAGVLECIQISLPLSPTRVVLMTWVDKPDDEGARVRGSRHHASSFNAFTIASADRQWFHLPGTSPPVGTGKLLPVSRELIAGYSGDVAAHSRRRAEVSKHVQEKIGRNLDDREVAIIRVSRS